MDALDSLELTLQLAAHPPRQLELPVKLAPEPLKLLSLLPHRLHLLDEIAPDLLEAGRRVSNST